MDLITELGPLAIASRLKRLSDYIFEEVQQIYDSQGLKFSSRVFPVLFALHKEDRQQITDISKKLQLTHAAISQVSKELVKLGLVKVVADETDKRKTLLVLTNKAYRILEDLEPLWSHINAALKETIDESGGQLLDVLSQFEKALKIKTPCQRVTQKISEAKNQSVEIVGWNPKYAAEFGILNRGWLKEFGCPLEEEDKLYFADPFNSIVAKGGAIFFALRSNIVVGTCALIKEAPNSFELARMAVVPQLRRYGIGSKLLKRALDWAKERKAKKVRLETITRLEGALALYQNFGFQKSNHLKAHAKRANIVMEKTLD